MPLTTELASLPFCCGETEGDKDLEVFFHHNALLYAQERLGKTYCFVNNEGEFSEIVEPLYTRLMFLDLMHTQILDCPFVNLS